MNKICLITGSSSGIGLEAAKQIAQKGYDLILLNRSIENNETAQNDILSVVQGCKIQLYTANLSNTTEIKKVAAQIKSNNEKTDVLINNAEPFFRNLKNQQMDLK